MSDPVGVLSDLEGALPSATAETGSGCSTSDDDACMTCNLVNKLCVIPRYIVTPQRIRV